MRAVLEAVAERLRNGDESLIRIPEICEATGINYGSVYHHFGSREGVIDAAYEMMFTGMVNEDIATLRGAIESATSLAEYVAAMGPVLRSISTGEERMEHRTMRVRVVSAALTRPGLRKVIGQAQADLTRQLTDIVRLGQGRGWLRPDLPAQALAVMVQVIVFGRTLDDVSAEPIDLDEWNVLVQALFSDILNQG